MLKSILTLLASACALIGWTAPENTLPLRIGADQDGGNRFPGSLAAIRIYDRALTADEIAGLAKRGPAEKAASKPLREWLPGQLRDGRVADTVVQSVASAEGEVAVRTMDGVAGAKFSGGFLQVKNDPAFKLPGDFTVEAWIRPDGDSQTCRIVDKITPGGANGFLLDFLNGSLRCIVGSQTVVRDYPQDPGIWTHVAATSSGTKITLYVDGTSGSRSDKPGVTFSGTAEPPSGSTTLWWRRPAGGWTEAMVLGNGRLGAMVSGGVDKETIWLNEDTLWSGEPSVPSNPNALAAFPEVRRLLIERKENEAHQLFNRKMLGPWNECYMPLGNLNLRFPIAGEIQNYRRTLNLGNGTASVQFKTAEAPRPQQRLAFVSYPDQALVYHVANGQPGQVSFSASLGSPIRHQVQADGQVLRLTGRCPVHADPHYLGNRIAYDEGPNPKGMTFAIELRAIAKGGEISVADGRLVAKNCDEVTLVLTAATSYNGFDKSPSREGRDPVALCRKQGEAALAAGYEAMLGRHAADFQSLMGRVSLDLGATAAAQRPTDERVRGGFRPEDLPALAALYYQFGRYLLASASRPGSQPSNLQGIWNRSMNPPWSANWTMNCNANFNYLGVEAANLSELHEPFIRLVQEWSADGARTARNWYGCQGWVGHHNCDLWRNACPVNGDCVWAAFPCGGAWACQDLWEHYAFTLDKDYLRQAWPTLRGSAEFFLDFLFQDPKTGYLVTGPDTNFENGFRKPNGPGAALCLGPTPSNMMVRQLFLNCIEATKVLECDPELRTRMEQAVAKLPPTVVNPRHGELQEYLDPAYEISGRSSCEVLSAWGAVWCNQITPRKTPELAAALRKAYEAPDRRPWATGQVGSWQGAFPSNTFARLGDGDRVGEILAKHFQNIVQGNFTAGFIQSEWQIDGNLGNMAAIGEMLMQSQDGQIECLPALPKAWQEGSVKGLRARGGFEVDIDWKNGRPTAIRILSTAGGRLRYLDPWTGKLIEQETRPGQKIEVKP